MGYERETNIKRELASPEARKMFQQFLKNPEGLGGSKPDYDRGYEFSFRFTQEERDRVNLRMELAGETFAEAFDVMYPFICQARNK